jgi:hypothetical protein
MVLSGENERGCRPRPRSAVHVGRAEVSLVDHIPRLAGMVVLDAEEAGEMAREFAHGLDRKAVPKA